MKLKSTDPKKKATKRYQSRINYRVKDYDLLFNVVGLTGLGVFVFIVYAIVFLEIPKENKDVWMQLIGICQGVALSIFGYFFGSAFKKNTK